MSRYSGTNVAAYVLLIVTALALTYTSRLEQPREAPVRRSHSRSACFPRPTHGDSIRILLGIRSENANSGTRATLRDIYDRFTQYLNPSDIAQVVFYTADVKNAEHFKSSPDNFGDIVMLGHVDSVTSQQQSLEMRFMQYAQAESAVLDYDFVIKLESDTILNLPVFFESLRSLRAANVYWSDVNAAEEDFKTEIVSGGLLKALGDLSFTGRNATLGTLIADIPAQLKQPLHMPVFDKAIVLSPLSSASSLFSTNIQSWQVPSLDGVKSACGKLGELRANILGVKALHTVEALQRTAAWWFEGVALLPQHLTRQQYSHLHFID